METHLNFPLESKKKKSVAQIQYSNIAQIQYLNLLLKFWILREIFVNMAVMGSNVSANLEILDLANLKTPVFFYSICR